MSSLQLSQCMVVSGGNRISISPTKYRGNGRGRFVVSCEGGGENNGIDRRNLLMGLGGLYGAANLIISDPKAVASPIPHPDFTKCVDAFVPPTRKNPNWTMNDKCCPPWLGEKVEPYVLPDVKKMRVRKAAHRFDQRSIDKYEEAIRRMKALDEEDPRSFEQQAKIHCAYCNAAYPQSVAGFDNVKISVHSSWLFFPFHRWYLYFFERILGHLLEDPDFALPYWNWDHPKGMTMPPMFQANKNSPLYNEKRNQDHIDRAIINLKLGPDSETNDLQKIENNLSIMHNEMIGVLSSAEDFMGKAYKAGDPMPPPANGGAVENGSHTAVHAWVGDPREKFNEDLGNFYSAGNDPLFYCHHANVDRMWTIWKNLGTDVPKNIHHPDFLESSFLFYDENKKLRSVTVADCLDNTKLGYAYEYSDITPWVNIPLKKKGARANIKELSKNADRAEDVKFPITLSKTTRILVKKTVKGKADEVLVLENVNINDTSSNIMFDVFVNDQDNDFTKLNRAEYAGVFKHLLETTPHSHSHSDSDSDSSAVNVPKKANIDFNLKELYENIDIDDQDEEVVVTLHPVYSGGYVTIGGIKIINKADLI